MKKLFLSVRGIGLIEVLIAAAIAGGIGLAIMQMLSTGSKGTKGIGQSLARNEVEATLQMIFQDSKLCSVAFKRNGVPAKFDPLASPQSDLNRVDFAAAMFLQNNKTTNGANPTLVTNLALTNVPSYAPVSAGVGKITHLVDFSYQLSRSKDSTGSANIPTSTFHLYLTTDTATNTILNCSTKRSANNFIFAMHSQTAIPPNCPAASNQLWTGNSLIAMAGDNFGGAVSLSTSGSCLPFFRRTLAEECRGASCQANTPGDYTFWLTTTDGGATPGRCSVCASTAPPLTIHSQTSSPPVCPAEYHIGWSGYSFSSIRVVDGAGGKVPDLIQDLGGPGSCLPNFRIMPFMECDDGGCAGNTGGDFAYYLTNNSSSSNNPSAVSRCTVCIPD